MGFDEFLLGKKNSNMIRPHIRLGNLSKHLYIGLFQNVRLLNMVNSNNVRYIYLTMNSLRAVEFDSVRNEIK